MSQHGGSFAQTVAAHGLHETSSGEPVAQTSCSQVGQFSPHSCPACSTHAKSHSIWQQNGSCMHTPSSQKPHVPSSGGPVVGRDCSRALRQRRSSCSNLRRRQPLWWTVTGWQPRRGNARAGWSDDRGRRLATAEYMDRTSIPLRAHGYPVRLQNSSIPRVARLAHWLPTPPSACSRIPIRVWKRAPCSPSPTSTRTSGRSPTVAAWSRWRSTPSFRWGAASPPWHRGGVGRQAFSPSWSHLSRTRTTAMFSWLARRTRPLELRVLSRD